MLFCGELWRIFLKVFTTLSRFKGRLGSLLYRDHIMGLLKGSMVITIDTEERCLLLYPSSVWSKIQDKISKLPSFNKNARRIKDFNGHAEDIDVDSSGRILISKPLREYASLSKEIF